VFSYKQVNVCLTTCQVNIVLFSLRDEGLPGILELFDQEAMNKDAGTRRPEIYTLGTNSDIDRFVAERTSSYETRNNE